MIDDKTPKFSLPLPHADNLLEDDVDRLRSALIELDAQLDVARLARSTLAESLTALTGAQSGLGGDLAALLNSLNSHKAAPASASSPGHAKPGTGLSADAAGALSVAYGTNPGTACQGDDPRLSADRAPIPHKHAVGDLTGTLPVANGGTGLTSLQATRDAMGLGNTTGVLPVANGGTGNSSGIAADSARWSGAAKTVSTGGPSGGADGDIWIQYI